MKGKSFTLIELLISFVIFSIMASISVFTYNKVVESNKERICIQNQLLINTLLELYTREENAVPASLGSVPEAYFEKALAKVKEKDPFFMHKRFVYKKLESLINKKSCYAAALSDLVGRKDFLICPSDQTPVGSSYAINSALVNYKATNPATTTAYDAYIDFRNRNIPVVVDSDNTTFSYTINIAGAAARHGSFMQEKYSITVTAKSNAWRCNQYGSIEKLLKGSSEIVQHDYNPTYED